MLGNTPLQVELTLMHTQSHRSKNTSEEHLLAFYTTFDQIKKNNYDGLIITGDCCVSGMRNHEYVVKATEQNGTLIVRNMRKDTEHFFLKRSFFDTKMMV